MKEKQIRCSSFPWLRPRDLVWVRLHSRESAGGWSSNPLRQDPQTYQAPWPSPRELEGRSSVTVCAPIPYHLLCPPQTHPNVGIDRKLGWSHMEGLLCCLSGDSQAPDKASPRPGTTPNRPRELRPEPAPYNRQSIFTNVKNQAPDTC